MSDWLSENGWWIATVVTIILVIFCAFVTQDEPVRRLVRLTFYLAGAGGIYLFVKLLSRE